MVLFYLAVLLVAQGAGKQPPSNPHQTRCHHLPLPLSISQPPGSCRAWLEPEFCPIHHPYQGGILAVLREGEERSGGKDGD